MKPSLFITGAGGFLGRQLLAKLDPVKYEKIVCLELKRENVRFPGLRPQNVEIIEADLLHSDAYQLQLNGIETVIHLAALTGKVNPPDYFKVNTYGTMLLLDKCKAAGVKNFLFVSSIAVSFQEKHRYFYAHSKEQAEQQVRDSGLNYAILRPTIIIGKGSPVFAGLAQLASLPVIPVFGKGKNLVQPIHVEDIAKAVRHILENGAFHGETFEIGGPESIPIEEFLLRIAQIKAGKTPSVFHLPVNLIAFFLSLAERLVYRFLPLTVGQLASFRNDVAAEENEIQKRLAPLMTGIDAMIRDSLDTDPLPELPPRLAKECRTFSKYLTNQTPNNYILEKYAQCHQKINFTPSDFHDKLLLKLATIRPLFTRMCDAYSRFFRPTSTLRKKLTYLMGILETTPPYSRYYDSTDIGGLVGFILKLGVKSLTLALHLVISIIFLLPLQILAKLVPKPSPPVEGQ